MRRGPLPLQLHAAMEPVAAILLIASSWIFNFSSNGTAQAVTVIIGVIMLVTGLLTDWRFSIARVIPLRLHFMTDLLVGVLLIISPFVLGFHHNGGATRFAVIFGILELLTALSTKWEPAADASASPARRSRVQAAR